LTLRKKNGKIQKLNWYAGLTIRPSSNVSASWSVSKRMIRVRRVLSGAIK